MMNRLLLPVFCCIPVFCFSQSAIDGYMKGKRNLDLAVTYSNESYEDYYFGDEKRAISNTIQSVSLFLDYGISDSLDLVVSIPYLWTDSLNSNFQDAIVALKFRKERKNFSNGALSIIASAGLSFPISDYPRDTEKPIGEGAVSFTARLLAQYEFYSGFFLHLQSGYNFKVTPDSQNAIPILAKIGYATSKIYADAWMDYFHTFSAGTDTRIAGGAGMVFLKVGGTVYYPVAPRIGVFAGVARTLSGQNVGRATRVNLGGVVKFFKK